MLCCWLLRYRFTIFSHFILMNFPFPLCFSYSLLLNNADHHSTYSYTHLASETNSLWSRIFKFIHDIPCWFLGWVYWKFPWWQMNMEHCWIGNVPENMFCVEITLPRDTFLQQISQGLPWNWNNSSAHRTRCLTANDINTSIEKGVYEAPLC
jgi:hypothetical protein